MILLSQSSSMLSQHNKSQFIPDIFRCLSSLLSLAPTLFLLGCDRCDSKKTQITVVYAHARESDRMSDLQQGLFATKKEGGEMQCIQ